MARCLWLILCGWVGVLGATEPEPVRYPVETLRELTEYVTQHHQDPVKYVVKKFEDHDIIFIGEHHYIKHDAEFVQSLIPAVYEKGVHNLGIEFGRYRDQKLVDQLLTAPEYNEELARQLMFRCYVLWGYKEYLNLYRAAWSLNSRLEPGKPKFRIVHLNAVSDWSQLKTSNRSLLEMRGVWPEGYPDQVMARVILDEFVAKRQKALLYMGRHHAFTRYEEAMPSWTRLLTPARAGRTVFQKTGNKAFMIALHSPWRQQNGDYAPPVGGVIDAVLSHANHYPIAFDTRGTPFGKLSDCKTSYAQRRNEFTLQDFCDGYIFLKPMTQYEMVTVDEHFIHKANLQEAIAQISDPDARKKCRSVADVLALIRQEARQMSAWQTR